MGDNPHFLDTLVTAFETLHNEAELSTPEFVVACTNLLPIFDGLGSIFAAFPKQDLQAKAQSLHQVQETLGTLRAVVEEDKKNGTIAVKNSCGRNLHRLIIIQDFVRHIFVNLLDEPEVIFRVAVTNAYDTSLGKIHTWTVRTAIRTGMYTLPTTEQFLTSINETQESGKSKATRLVELATPVVERLYALFEGVNIPGSDVKFFPK